MAGGQALDRLLLPHGTFRIRVLLAMVRYRWFVRARWIMALATIVLLAIERWLLPDFSRPGAVAFCIGALAIVNVIWTVVGFRLLKETDNHESVSTEVVRRVVLFANAQIIVDLLVLTVILRYSGGIENPMAVFYLFHMLIAALLLTPANAWLQGVWALLLYAGATVGECAGLLVPHHPFLPSAAGAGLFDNWAYVLAGVGVLGAGVFGALYFTLQISSRLDEQERELEASNDALMHSQSAIRDLQARRSRFMQTSAHQLKSPVTGIEMLAGLIRDDVVPPEGVKKIVGRILDRCGEAIVQVTELLTLARIQAAHPADLRSARTDLNTVVQRVTDRLAMQAKAKNLAFNVDTSGSGAFEIAVEERDLADCVANLIENAIKYTPSGGSVDIATSRTKGTVSLSVKDTGMGIAEDAADEIFDPYRRGNLALARSIPGSGLGLAIVREVVEQANGHISVQSTVGQGSEFVVEFPCSPKAARGAPIVEPVSNQLETGSTIRRKPH